jgi:hypothetical protein
MLVGAGRVGVNRFAAGGWAHSFLIRAACQKQSGQGSGQADEVARGFHGRPNEWKVWISGIPRLCNLEGWGAAAENSFLYTVWLTEDARSRFIQEMKQILRASLLLCVLAIPTNAAPAKISGSFQLRTISTNKEVNTVKIGQDYVIRWTDKNLNLLANKNATLNYNLSVLPKGLSAPVSFSGRLSTKVTLPASEGGAQETSAELAQFAGTRSYEQIITIPDVLPEGDGTITVSLTVKGSGSITATKRVKVVL